MAREFDTVVVDSSAVVAVFKDEPDAHDLAERLASFPNRVISAANFLEAAIVCEKWAGQLSAGNDFDVVIATLMACKSYRRRQRR